MQRDLRFAPLGIPTILTIFAASLAACAPAGAATVTVDWSGGGDHETIQDGVDAASPGDTVLVAPGVYAGPSNRAIRFNGKDLSLVSMAGAVLTTVNCGWHDRGFIFDGGESSAALVRGFTVENGLKAGGGGAMLCVGSSPTIEECAFAHCAADSGGAFLMNACYSTVTDCDFRHNGAAGRGGAVYLASSDPTFSGCEFSGNDAEEGGAVYCDESSPMISSCSFSDNEASISGGALHLDWSSPYFQRCTLSGNTAEYAGAVYCFWSTPVLFRCTLVANTGVHGGAMWCSVQDAAAVLEKSIIAFSEIGSAVDGFAWFLCSDVFGNEGGDWIYPIEDQLDTYGNFAQDPLFCGDHNPEFAYTLHEDSPCAGENNPSCGGVGAWGVGCPSSTGIDGGGHAETTWGGIKALYR